MRWPMSGCTRPPRSGRSIASRTSGHTYAPRRRPEGTRASPSQSTRGGVRRPGPGCPGVPPEAPGRSRPTRDSPAAAIGQALKYQTYDAAYVQTLLLQQRRRQELPSPMPLRPKRPELIEDIHLEEPDPARYDRLCGSSDEEEPTP